MADTYAGLVGLVRDWANRDSSVLPDSIIQSALSYAADHAYRNLKIPPLESTVAYVVSTTGAAETYVLENGTTVSAPYLNVGTLATGDTLYGTTDVELPVPSDAVQFYYLRQVGKVRRDTNNNIIVKNVNTDAAPVYEFDVQMTPSNSVVYNEKTDLRTFYDFYADKTSSNYWSRHGANILASGQLSGDEVFELHYSRRLPALNARLALPAGVTTLGQVTGQTEHAVDLRSALFDSTVGSTNAATLTFTSGTTSVTTAPSALTPFPTVSTLATALSTAINANSTIDDTYTESTTSTGLALLDSNSPAITPTVTLHTGGNEMSLQPEVVTAPISSTMLGDSGTQGVYRFVVPDWMANRTDIELGHLEISRSSQTRLILNSSLFNQSTAAAVATALATNFNNVDGFSASASGNVVTVSNTANPITGTSVGYPVIFMTIPAASAVTIPVTSSSVAPVISDADTVLSATQYNALSDLDKATYTLLEGSYVRRTTEVSNWLKNQNERVLLFGALHQVFDYLQETEQSAVYRHKFMESIEELNMEEKKRVGSGGNTAINYNGFGLI